MDRLRRGRTATLGEERVEDLRIPHADDGVRVRPEVEELDQPHGVRRGWLMGHGPPLDLVAFRRQDGHLVGCEQVEEGGAREKGGVEPQRPIGDEEVDTGRAEGFATHGAAPQAARREHGRRNGEA